MADVFNYLEAGPMDVYSGYFRSGGFRWNERVLSLFFFFFFFFFFLGGGGRGTYEEHLGEIILNLDQLFRRRRCHLKIFVLYLALVAMLFG